MNFSQTLLTRLQAAPGVGSGYKCAQLLGMTRQAISGVKNGRNHFSDETVVKIADLLGQDPVEVLAGLHLETEKSHKMRMVWQEILEGANLARGRAVTGSQAEKVA